MSDPTVAAYNEWAANPSQPLPNGFEYLKNKNPRIREAQPFEPSSEPSGWIYNTGGARRYLFPNPNTFNQMTNIRELYKLDQNLLQAKGSNAAFITDPVKVDARTGFIEYSGSLEVRRPSSLTQSAGNSKKGDARMKEENGQKSVYEELLEFSKLSEYNKSVLPKLYGTELTCVYKSSADNYSIMRGGQFAAAIADANELETFLNNNGVEKSAVQYTAAALADISQSLKTGILDINDIKVGKDYITPIVDTMKIQEDPAYIRKIAEPTFAQAQLAVKQDGWLIKDINAELFNEREQTALRLDAFENNRSTLRLYKEIPPEVYKVIAEQYPSEFKQIRKEAQTEEMARAFVSKDGLNLKYVDEKYAAAVYEDALKQNPKAIEFVKDPNFKLSDEQIEQLLENPFNIKSVPAGQLTEEAVIKAAKKNGMILRYFEKADNGKSALPQELKTPDVILAAVGNTGEAIKYVRENERTQENTLKAVETFPPALRHLTKEERTEEHALAAVEKNGLALKYLDPDEKTGRVCERACKQNGGALEYVPKENRSVTTCLAAVMRYPAAIYKMTALPKGQTSLRWKPETFEYNIQLVREQTGFAAADAALLLMAAMKPGTKNAHFKYLEKQGVSEADFYTRIDAGLPGIPPRPGAAQLNLNLNPKNPDPPKQELPAQARTLKPPSHSYGMGR